MQRTIETILIATAFAGAVLVAGLLVNRHQTAQEPEQAEPTNVAQPASGTVAAARAQAGQARQLNATAPTSRFDDDGESDQELALHIDSQCRRESAIEADLSAQDNIRQRLSIAMNGAMEETSFFTERSLFWERDGQHYQITATWERDQPARYRMEFYRAPDADFSNAVEAVELPPIPPGGIDALSATELQDQLLQEHRSQGAVATGKVLIVRAIDQSAKEMHELTLFNDELLNWSFPQGVCLLNDAGDALDCECLAEEHRHGHA